MIFIKFFNFFQKMDVNLSSSFTDGKRCVKNDLTQICNIDVNILRYCGFQEPDIQVMAYKIMEAGNALLKNLFHLFITFHQELLALLLKFFRSLSFYWRHFRRKWEILIVEGLRFF